LIETDVDNGIGEGFVDDVLEPFSIAASLEVESLEGGEIGLNIPFVSEGLELGMGGSSFTGVHIFVPNGLGIGGPGILPIGESDHVVSGLVPFLDLISEEGPDESDPLDVQCLRIEPEIVEIVDDFLLPRTERGFWLSVVGS
jgi:hypothetical protein